MQMQEQDYLAGSDAITYEEPDEVLIRNIEVVRINIRRTFKLNELYTA